MVYKRVPNRYRRIVQAQPAPALSVAETVKEPAVPDRIPLPNEAETPPPKATYALIRKQRSNPLQKLFRRINVDDLILISLILLFLDEGLDEMEDDFLLVILIYLLLSGRS